MPGLIKIGQTEETALQSADKLYTTGVPLPFDIVHEYPCENHEQLGRAIDRKLASHRYNPDRDFFTYSSNEAYQLLEALQHNLQDRSHRRYTSQYLTRFRK